MASVSYWTCVLFYWPIRQLLHRGSSIHVALLPAYSPRRLLTFAQNYPHWHQKNPFCLGILRCRWCWEDVRHRHPLSPALSCARLWKMRRTGKGERPRGQTILLCVSDTEAKCAIYGILQHKNKWYSIDCGRKKKVACLNKQIISTINASKLLSDFIKRMVDFCFEQLLMWNTTYQSLVCLKTNLCVFPPNSNVHDQITNEMIIMTWWQELIMTEKNRTAECGGSNCYKIQF